MRLSRLMSVAAVMMMAIAASTIFAVTLRDKTAKDQSDPISGDWEVTLEVEGIRVPATFKLKLDGDKVSGTANSEHTGPGTLSKGSWAGDQISFTLDFAAHESIAVTGHLKDGKLAGEFRTEGRLGHWEAKKK